MADMKANSLRPHRASIKTLNSSPADSSRYERLHRIDRKSVDRVCYLCPHSNTRHFRYREVWEAHFLENHHWELLETTSDEYNCCNISFRDPSALSTHI